MTRSISTSVVPMRTYADGEIRAYRVSMAISARSPAGDRERVAAHRDRHVAFDNSKGTDVNRTQTTFKL